jgi:hypothetical protein
LSPIVTAGLPAPGPLAAGAGVLTDVLAALELDEDLLLPHAPSTMLSDATSSADRALARLLLSLLRLLLDILASDVDYWMCVMTASG